MKEKKQILTKEEETVYKGLLRFAKQIKLKGNKISIIISPSQKCRFLWGYTQNHGRGKHNKKQSIINSLRRKGILKVVKLSNEWCFQKQALPKTVPNEQERKQLVDIVEKDIQVASTWYKNPSPHPTVYEIKKDMIMVEEMEKK